MTVTTYTVTGNIFLPSGKVPPNARVRFKLTAWTEEAANVIPPDAVEATVNSGGDFSAVVVPATYRISVISDVQGITRETVLTEAATVTADATLTSLI
jgi:hypothetical protein